MPKYGTDLSKSAIDLKNPLEVRDVLVFYGKTEAARNVAQAAHDEAVMDMPTYQALQREVASMGAAHKAVKEAIDRCGSLQDIPEGLYAIKQAKTNISYTPGLVREFLPENVVALAITETVTNEAIAGLVKGKFISEEQAARCRVIRELAPAYIIGMAQKPVEEVPNDQ